MLLQRVRIYSSVNYTENAFIIFGKETKGLPDDILSENWIRP